MPARFADRLDVNADRDAVQGSLLATVPGCHLDLVLLLSVIAQLLCVPDVTWQKESHSRSNSTQIAHYNVMSKFSSLLCHINTKNCTEQFSKLKALKSQLVNKMLVNKTSGWIGGCEEVQSSGESSFL